MKTHLALHALLSSALVLGGLLCGNGAQALTRTVPEQFSTIQAAINAANTGDTVLVGPGLYSGSGNTGLDTLGKAITIKSSAGPGATYLDGGQSAQVFNIHKGETVKTVISGFTIQHGSAAAGSAVGGGGISVHSSSPTLTNCVIQDNVSGENGGGMYVISGSPAISNCVFYANTSQGFGGGLYLLGGAPKVSACTFEGNSASALGGGLFLEADKSTVSGCSFESNTAANGGGIAADLGSSASLSNCVVIGNTATAAGGGISVTASSSNKLSGCEFLGNSAPQGGGADIDSSSPSFTGCSFSQNTASDTTNGTGGGAILITTSTGSSKPKLTTCLFTLNTGLDGGAILSFGAPSISRCVFTNNTGANDGGAFDGLGGSCVLVNCVFLSNTAAKFNGGALRFANSCVATLTNDSFSGNFAPDNGDAIHGSDSSSVSVNNCIVWDSNDPGGPGNDNDIVFQSTGTLKIANTDDFDGVQSGTGNLSADPLYVNPGEGDLYLQVGSPCLGTANPKAPDFSKTDIDGDPRNPKTPSMGAYEG